MEGKYLSSISGASDGCKCILDKAASTLTVSEITKDITIKPSLGELKYITYTASSKVVPTDKNAFLDSSSNPVGYNEDNSTFDGQNGQLAFEGMIYKISTDAFKGNEYLESINLDMPITDIGENAFLNCSKLESVLLPSGELKSIGKAAFKNTALSQIIYSGFSDSGNLNIPSAYSTWDKLSSIGEEAFSGTELQEITIGKNVTSLADGLFKNCTSLETVRLYQTNSDKTVKTLGNDVFKGVDSTKLHIDVNQNNDHTFLLSYKAADGWKELPNGMIREKGSAITLIHYEASQKVNFNKYYFFGNEGNKRDYFEYLDDDYCSRFKEGKGDWFIVNTQGKLLTVIPAYLFGNEYYSHPDAKILTGVTLPESITMIDCQAFFYCIGLKSIVFTSNNAVEIENSVSAPAFHSDVMDLIKLYVPKSDDNAVLNAYKEKNPDFAEKFIESE